ncbi:MAG: disulfide bond formation protein B, partial [Acidimicrobiia bacterium]|nr:disulfide bond formation protein B [Acidimicrobiia bacterium]
MNIFTFNIFTAILALLSLGASVVLLIARPFLKERLGSETSTAAVWLAAIVAIFSTVGSLIYSEFWGFEPCRYCWFQRIAMYPLALVLLISGLRTDGMARRYGIPLAAIGLPISIYHYWQQTSPPADGGSCGVVSCISKYVNTFDFISIPFMAGCGFLLVLVL